MPLKLGVIGVGHMGRIHTDKLRRMDGVELVGIVDIDPAHAAETAKQHGIPQFESYSKLINAAEAVVIATPTESHYTIAKDALTKGIHVFMEKPITSTAEEGRELVELADEKKAVLQIGHLERFSPAFRKASPLIDNPLYINASRVSPFTGRSTDVDVVLDLMIHDLDLTLFIVKGKVTAVRAQGAPVVTDVIDMACAQIEFSNGCVANLSVSRVARKKERTFRIFQRSRYMSLDFLRGRMTTATKSKQGAVELQEYEADSMDPVRDELSEFVTAISEARRPHVEGEHGLQALILANRVKEAIYEYIAKTESSPEV